MCKICFENEIYNFKTFSEFENFEKELTLKARHFTISNSKEKKLNDSISYQCNSCLETWYLSEPDNAWRGYFLRKDSARAYSYNLKKSNSKKKYGCLILLIFISLFIFYNLIK